MGTLLQKFHDLYSLILQGQSEIKASNDIRQAVLNFNDRYLSAINIMRLELTKIPDNTVNEKFFYATIGMYDHIMMSFLTTNLNINTSFVDENSLESRVYRTAKFGEKIFDDINIMMTQSNNKDILKVYLNILHISFSSKIARVTEMITRLSKILYNGEYTTIPTDFFVSEEVARGNNGLFNINYSYIYSIGLSALFLITTSLIWWNTTNTVFATLESISLE